MNKNIFTFITAFIFFAVSTAQNISTSSEFQSKYHMIDSSELYQPRVAGKSFVSTPPPVGTIRAIPEWDVAQAVLISYNAGFGIPYSLIAELSQDINVITIVESAAQQTTVTNNYNSNGVNIANCSFVTAPLDSYWSRDYGPWFIMVNHSEIAVVDFPYNRPSRPNDDNVPVIMAPYLGETLYGMDVMHTGGNYMCDGMGVAAMTNLVNDDNPTLTAAQIDTLFKQYMGITKNYITTDPLGAYIKHIDCWGKFLDVDKILIGQVPITNSQYNAYEAMATYWANETSSYGDPYQVYRTYEPNGEPYSNSLILNNKVFIPFVPGSTTENNAAMAVYQQAMPGYYCFGISYSSWVSTDALHCRTHEIADKNMLYVYHVPYWGEQPVQTQYDVNADIYALSGSAVIADSVWLSYKVNNGSWNQVSMNFVSGNQWTGAIPQQLSGDTIRYYIHASDLSPHSVTHPLIGIYDPHKFWVSASASINEAKSAQALVFPNPANDFIFVQMKDCTSPDVNIKLISAVGNEIISFNEKNTCDRMIRINTSNVAPGSYFLRISSGEKSLVKKVMIMH